MKLWEINDALRDVQLLLDASVDAETGELDEALVDAALATEVDLETKALSVAAFIKLERAEALRLGELVKDVAKRVKQHTSKAEWLERYLEHNVPERVPWASDFARLGWGSGSVMVLDQSLVPEEYMRQPPIPVIPAMEVDKVPLLAKLKAGEDVPGVRLHFSLKVK